MWIIGFSRRRYCYKGKQSIVTVEIHTLYKVKNSVNKYRIFINILKGRLQPFLYAWACKYLFENKILYNK